MVKERLIATSRLSNAVGDDLNTFVVFLIST